MKKFCSICNSLREVVIIDSKFENVIGSVWEQEYHNAYRCLKCENTWVEQVAYWEIDKSFLVRHTF